MPALTFLEVDPEDRAGVLGRYPQATVLAGPRSGPALVEACRDSDAVSCFIHSPFTAAVIAALPRLRLLCTRSVGYDHIDLAACHARGITVCNVPDYGSHVIAEHVFALLLSTLRRIPEGDRRVEQGTFDYHGLRGMALKDKTIGIVGTGRTGARVARIAHGFGMTILAHDPCRLPHLSERYGVTYVPLPWLLAGSDIITLHVPGTDATRHMIDDAAFATMKRGAVLVNTARGSLIDSAALVAALNDGTIAHALLDVLEHEPRVAEDRALVSHPRVVSTPHVAFYADDALRNMYLDTFASMDQWMAGATPQHAVHPPPAVCDVPRPFRP